MSIETVVWIAAVFLLAGYARGYSGFGFSAVTVSGLSLVVDPVVAVSTAVLLEVFASVVQARSIWRQVDWKGSAILLAGGFLGTPIGVLILDAAAPSVVKAAIYCFLLVAAVIITFARPMHVSLSPLAWFCIAIAAGIVNGASALSGLLIVVVMTLAAIPPVRMRATLIAYFFFSDLYATGLLGWRGMIGSETLWMCASAIPLILVGIHFGSRRFHATSDAHFRRATMIFLSGLSLVGLATLVFQP